MGKYFGTDGVRGEANVELTPELAFKLGRFGGYVLSQHEEETPLVFVGRDTRISGEMLEHALIAGLLSVGIRVYKLGVIATPGVAYLVRTEKASAGVMISAIHNPALDYGIKFFGGDGFKLDDDRELEIEALLDAAEDTLPRPSAQGLGTVMEYPEGLRKYQEFLVSTGVQLEGMHVVLDTANGAASTSARQIFADLGAQLTVIGENPDGLNINDGVGSTHPEHLQEKVKEVGAAIGLAFDGDSDRLIAVDENGEIVDITAEKGDQVMKDLVFKNKGARALGECALVPDPSPISQSGITFFNTLFDENASNHLAIGAAYATSVEGGAEFTEEELEAAGLNRSDVHVDFMIGSSQMDIDGIREDGTRVPVFRNGDWAI